MLRNSVLIFLMLLCFACDQAIHNEPKQLKLWFDKPAANWNEALPLGNGRLGAMVHGNPAEENIQLNEATIWSGGPHRNDNPDTKAILSDIRQLLFDGKNEKAYDLTNAKIISKTSHGMPYETARNLRLKFDGHDSFTNYYRELDIEKAVQKTSYTVDDVEYERNVFTSFTDQVLIIKLTASKPGKLTFSTTMDRPGSAPISISTEGDDVLKMLGRSHDRKSKRILNNIKPTKGRVKFQSRVKIVPEDGTIQATDSSLIVEQANGALIYVSIATNFVNYQDINANENKRAFDYLASAEKKNYDSLLSSHLGYYKKFFNRVSLNLGETDLIKNPTDVRIKQFSTGNDPSIAVLYFQFGRYLLISASQPGGQPANLQGIWCNQITPPWKSAYTININTEMNYWPAEPTNLPEMHEPLIDMVKELSIAGRQTAKDMYGADGWVTHHNTDLWRICGPVDGATWGMWPSGEYGLVSTFGKGTCIMAIRNT